MDCDLCLKNPFSVDQTKRFGEGKFTTWYEKFLAVRAGREREGLSWEGGSFPGFEGLGPEADNHQLEGGKKIHCRVECGEGWTCDH